MSQVATDPEDRIRDLAQGSLTGDATGWFEQLYDEAAHGRAVVPWDRGVPHPLLVEWVDETGLDGTGKTAVVVGCGFGFDAELLAGRGFETTAFDVSESAVDAARRRHSGSRVTYEPADLFTLPRGWFGRFDLVVEIMTVQALPRRLRAQATDAVSGLVRSGGTLFVVATALGDTDDLGQGPPWPLTRDEIEAFARTGLAAAEVRERFDPPDIHRWRARFVRPARGADERAFDVE